MNYLAHFYLAGDSDELVVGNFIGDAVKGNDYLDYPEKIKQGILMHRAIDSFTDSHPLVRQSTHRLQEHYHKFSGILVDVFYDHFLAKNWSKFHAKSLNDFAQNSYKTLEENNLHLPEKAQFMLPYMKNGNWLYNYIYIEGIKRTLGGMARRSKFENNMHLGTTHLQEFYSEFENEFLEFFPQLIEHVAPYKS